MVPGKFQAVGEEEPVARSKKCVGAELHLLRSRMKRAASSSQAATTTVSRAFRRKGVHRFVSLDFIERPRWATSCIARAMPAIDLVKLLN